VKLYWRVKRNGKWTWRPAIIEDEITVVDANGNERKEVYVLLEEE
jgi:hypothetical protein